MKKNIFFAVAVSLFISSCGPSIKVTTDQNEGTDFSKYKSFSFLGWQKNSNEIMSEFDQKRMRDSFQAEFKARNLESKEEGGDLAVVLYLVVDQKTSIQGYTNYYGGGYGRYGRYGGGWGAGSSSTTYTQEDYLQGTLVMDVFDEETGQQVWQGIATGTVEENPQKREKSIPNAVHALMKKFPIEPVK